MLATAEELVEVEEIGEVIARSVVDFFSKPQNQMLIERLTMAGVQMQMAEVQQHSDALNGLKIVISGVFKKYDRDELKKMIELNGGANVSSISAKTNFVLAGDGMGPAKLEKATKLGVRIVTEDEFLAMIGR
jgi:DNA ligase (NAD+)